MWEPKEKSHGPKTDWPYVEMETLRFFRYTLGRWKREPVKSQAQMIAHYLEHGIRESYASEKARLAAPAAAPPTENVTDFFRYRQGGGAA